MNLMSRLEDIERAVSELPPEDLRRFREWFSEFDDALWDRQIEHDSDSGRLEALANEARAEHRNRRTRPL